MMAAPKWEILDDELHAKAMNWIQPGAMDEVYDFSKMQMDYVTNTSRTKVYPITFERIFKYIRECGIHENCGMNWDGKKKEFTRTYNEDFNPAYYMKMWAAFESDEVANIKKVRKNEETEDIDYQQYNNYKVILPTVMLSGTTLKHDGRHLTGLNGCFQIDIDSKKENLFLREPKEFAKFKDLLANDKHSLFVTNSPSNKGLKVGFRIDPVYHAIMLQRIKEIMDNTNIELKERTKDCNLLRSKYCNNYWNLMDKYFRNSYDLIIDDSIQSENEVFYLPYDRDLRTNPNAEMFEAPTERPDINILKSEQSRKIESSAKSMSYVQGKNKATTGNNTTGSDIWNDYIHTFNNEEGWNEEVMDYIAHSPRPNGKGLGIDYMRKGKSSGSIGYTLFTNEEVYKLHVHSSSTNFDTKTKGYNLIKALIYSNRFASEKEAYNHIIKTMEALKPEYKNIKHKPYKDKRSDTQTDNKIPHVFWYGKGKGENRQLVISFSQFYEYLESIGIRKHLYGADSKAPAIVQIQNNVVELLDMSNTLDLVKSYIDSLPSKLDKEFYRSQLNETVIKNADKLLSYNKICLGLSNMPGLENFVRDTAETGYVFYKNGFVEVTADSITLKNYSELKGVIWKSQIKDRNIHLIDFADKKAIEKFRDTDFIQFTRNTCTSVEKDENGKPIKGTETFKEDKHRVLVWIIGFMLHTYKDPAKAISVILTDSTINGDEEGRSGKSLIGLALDKIRNTLHVPGKSVDLKDKFFWQNVDLDTQIIFLDDLKKNFEPTDLYTIITFGMSVEKKGGKKLHIPYKDSPKILITNNYGGLRGENGSDKARKLTFDLDPYYTYQHTPIDEDSKEHKGRVKQFFTEGIWSDEQWNNFDNFMLFCLKSYLENPDVPKYVSKNVEINAVSLTVGDDLAVFFENLPKNETFSAKDMRSKFVEENPSFKSISQNYFTRKLVKYCKLSKLKVDEKKNSGTKYFHIYDS